MIDDEDTTPLGPHWWDVFADPTLRRQPVVKTPRPRWPIILGALLLIGLVTVLTYPVFPSSTGN